jgi:hypothetical protein
MNLLKCPGNRFWNMFVRQRDFALIKLIGVLVVSGIILWAYSLLQERHPKWPEARLPEQLALIAILFAALQFTDAKEQSNELRQLLRAASTRSVGIFPDNMSDITEVVVGAKRHLYILTDFVAYGQYSAPRQFEKYIAALRKLPKRVDLQIVCYDAPTSKKAALEHLPDGDEYFEGKINRAVFEEFCNVNNIVPVPTSNAALRRTLDIREQNHSHGFNINYLRDLSPFYLWLQDDEAVITFKIKGDQETGLSFRTHDRDLVEQLKRIFNDARKYSTTFYRPQLSA